jgi:hypothetical protein
VSEEEQIAELLEVLLKSRGVRIDVSAVAAFTLVGLLQLSLRHKGVRCSRTSAHVAMQLVDLIQSQLPVETRQHIARGWDPNCDVPLDETIGPTGEFPGGRRGSHDKGGLNIGMSADPVFGVVRIQFGSLLSEISMDPEMAREMATGLMDAARKLGRG